MNGLGNATVGRSLQPEPVHPERSRGTALQLTPNDEPGPRDPLVLSVDVGHGE